MMSKGPAPGHGPLAIVPGAVLASDLSRRQLTIIAADVVDYSRLTEAAEVNTHVRLRALRVRIVDPCIVSYRGRIIRNTGDGFLATFDSPADALACAIEIQRDIEAADSAETSDRRIRFRIGANLGDVITEPEDIYGASVNIAARLEQYAPPGGIVVSAQLIELVRSRFDIPTDDLGQLSLKNISRPVRAYSLRIPGSDQSVLHIPRGRATRRAKIPSIVVLPFRTSGETQEDLYFGQGMVDDIIVALASIQGLLVISRTSALSYAGETDLQKVGQDLGVRYVLSGSVRRKGDGLRITADLADVESNSIIWADRYDGDLSDLFDLQDRIASRIVWSLAPQVREAELKRALRKRPENMNAYDLVMQAIDLIYRMNFEDFSRARGLLQKAISLDDNYAVAHAYYALWLSHNINQGWTSDQEADSQEAARVAAAACARDPANGFALAIHAHMRSLLFRDYDTGIAIFERALAAAPGNAMIWTLSSGVQSYIGEGKEAIRRAERGLRLSPVDTQAHFYLLFLALAHYVNGTYEESVIWAHKTMGLNPRLCSNMRWLIASLVALERLSEAREIAQTLLKIQPRFHLSAYEQWCPLKPDLRADLLSKLRIAGIPD
jgi:adenylate cyclase